MRWLQVCRSPMSPGPMVSQKGGNMSARTSINTSILTAHVPVDTFDIVNGPSQARCLHISEMVSANLHRIEQAYVDQIFTLKTSASKTVFKRKLRIATIFDVQSDGSFTFTAIFSDRTVSGIYNPKTKRGDFSLD